MRVNDGLVLIRQYFLQWPQVLLVQFPASNRGFIQGLANLPETGCRDRTFIPAAVSSVEIPRIPAIAGTSGIRVNSFLWPVSTVRKPQSR